MLFAHVMHEEYGGVEAALEFSQEAEQGGDVCAGVFIGAMQADEGIEEKKLWFDLLDGGGEFRSVGIEIESEGGGVDEVQVEGFDVKVSVVADAHNALADHWGRVLREVDEGGTGAHDREAA
jgi:hypothetical protein